MPNNPLPKLRDWISIGGIISTLVYGILESLVKDVYNFTKDMIPHSSFQSYTYPQQ
jgi:hypothetical protein